MNEIVRNNNIVTNTNSLVFDIFLTIVSSFTSCLGTNNNTLHTKQ